MPSTFCDDVSLATLPAPSPDADALLRQAPDLFGTLTWWTTTVAHALPADATPVFVQVRQAGRLIAVFPLLRRKRRLHSLTTPYSCVFTPTIANDLAPGTLGTVAASLARVCRTSPITRLDALAADASWLPVLQSAAKAARLHPLTFDHFGNWHEAVSGHSWLSYLAARPGALRETIRRRLRKAEALAGARFEILRTPAEADQATDAFAAVYARSWKTPEPFPAFHPALIRAVAAAGWLRLGLWSLDGRPVAVQLWIVRNGQALVLKLAHDEDFKALSPGTVLTALMLRHLLDQEHVAGIDFGRGDDPYKQGWAACRRQRLGCLLINPLHPAGAAALVQHTAGKRLTKLRARMDGFQSRRR